MTDDEISKKFFDDLLSLSSVKKLSKNYKEYNPPPFKGNTARTAHIMMVLKDPKFEPDFRKAYQSTKRSKYKLLLEKYALTATELATLTVGPVVLKIPGSLSPIRYDKEAKLAEITLEPTLNREEFEHIWDILQNIVSTYGLKKGLKRPPENPELIYAVFKQRRKKPATPYTKIFKLYRKEWLPGYTGKIKFDTYLELKRYYLRYRPDK